MANVKNDLKVDPTDVDVIVGMDQSGSMSWGSDRHDGGPTRWKKGEETLSAIATEVSAFDDDGLTVFLFNTSHRIKDGVKPEVVAELFRTNTPNDGTYLAPPITELVERFFPAKKKGFFSGGGYVQCVPVKPVAFIIYTDGCPADKNAVAAAIIDATKRTARGNVGFLFVQVGYDPDAEDFLKWLDTNLKGAAYDAVSRLRIEDAEDHSAKDLIIMALNGCDNS